MYHALARKLYVTDAQAEYSSPVEVTAQGTIEVQASALVLQSGVLEVRIETSNNRQDWVEPDSLTFVYLTSVGFGAVNLSGIAARFVRLKYVVVATLFPPASCVCAAGIRTQDTVIAPPRDSKEETLQALDRLRAAIRDPGPPVLPRIDGRPRGAALRPVRTGAGDGDCGCHALQPIPSGVLASEHRTPRYPEFPVVSS